jgi:hypothetical protein
MRCLARRGARRASPRPCVGRRHLGYGRCGDRHSGSSHLRAVPRPFPGKPPAAAAHLRFDATGNDQVVGGTVRNTEAAHVRLRLSNGDGKDTADDVVVIVTEVRRLEEPEGAMVEATPIGLPLTWSGLARRSQSLRSIQAPNAILTSFT